MLHLVPEFMTLFEGYREAYGTSVIDPRSMPDPATGKIKGSHWTIPEPVTEELWRLHLLGQKAIGIIPINRDSKCRWGCIDVDIYAIEHAELAKRVAQLKLPLILTRSKSGGAHLWLFLADFVLAGEMQMKLKGIAALLGAGDSEIFPKQVALKNSKGDKGNWVNMPYFNHAHTTRFCTDAEGRNLNADQFIRLARTKIISIETFYQLDVNPRTELDGGPPCLQHLARHKLQPGHRDNGMFSFGVYAKKAHPNNWEAKLQEYNTAYCSPPLEASEMENIIKSLNKKDYFYKCSDTPCRTYCNKDVCRECKFGIGEEGVGEPVKGSMTVYAAEPPIYFLDLEGLGRLCLTLDDLVSPVALRKACIAQLQRDPNLSMKDLKKKLDSMLKTATVIQAPPEATQRGVLETILKDWLCNENISDDINRLLVGAPVKLGTKYYFRLDALERELKRRRQDELERNELTLTLRNMGAESQQINLGKNRRVRTYSIEFSDITHEDVVEIKSPEVLY